MKDDYVSIQIPKALQQEPLESNLGGAGHLIRDISQVRMVSIEITFIRNGLSQVRSFDIPVGKTAADIFLEAMSLLMTEGQVDMKALTYKSNA